MNWWRALADVLAREDAVLVTVAQTRGSVPREAGTSMLVTLTDTLDTIGGGHLEWEAMAQARAMLLQPSAAPALQRLSLGASLGQCCGGVVWLVFERVGRGERDAWMARVRLVDAGSLLTRTLASSNEVSQWAICVADEVRNTGASLDTYPFPSPGADAPPSPEGEGTATLRPDSSSPLPLGGRVPRQGRERGNGATGNLQSNEADNAWARRAHPTHWQLTHHLTPPNFNITLFGNGHVGAAIIRILATLDANIRWIDIRDDLFGTTPANVTCIATDAPEDEVDNAPHNSFFLVLTHSHALDLQLTTRILHRDAFAWFGLIGSRTKRARFEHRLHAQGIPAERIARMTCPIGVPGISDKSPQAIAIAVVAQLLQARALHSHAASGERESAHDH